MGVFIPKEWSSARNLPIPIEDIQLRLIVDEEFRRL